MIPNQLFMMRQSVLLAFTGLALAAFVLSCKHEIPGNGQPGGGGNGGNPPPLPLPTGQTCSPDTVYFQQQVLPILVSNCSLSGCHDAASRQDGVVLTNYQSVISTGDVRAYNPGASEIWEKINDADPDDRMPPPPRAPLTAEQKNLIYKWIMQGAKNNSCQSATCDSTNVTYSGSIRSIVAGKCQGCHSSASPSGGYDLSQYTVMKARVTDGKLWGAINHLPGYSPMPRNGSKLTDCEIAQFRKWIADGAPNN